MRLSRNNSAYAFIALYPLAMLTAFVFLLKEIMPLPIPLLFPLVSGCISAAAASLYCDLTKNERFDRSAANIRMVIIILALSYLFSSLFRRGIPWSERFLPFLPNVLASTGALYTWSSVISLKKFFIARKRFDECTELYRGEKLKGIIFADPGLLQYTDEEIIKIRQNFLAQLVFTGIILLVNAGLKIPMSLALYFLLIGLLLSGICITGLLGIFRWEQYYAGEGLVVPAFDRTKRVLAMGIICSLCIAAAILLSSNRSLLPFSIIPDIFYRLLGLFLWLAGLFFWLIGRFLALFIKTGESNKSVSTELDTLSSFPDSAQNISLPIWEWLKYGFIILVAAAFIKFMITPLLNRGKAAGKLTLRRKMRRIIMEWFRGAMAAFASFFAFIGHRTVIQKLRKPGTEEIHKAAETVFAAYSQTKKRDMRRSVTLFARLIIWGSEVRQVSWKPSHAPGEYCSLLAASALQWCGEVIRIGELFEQALYSAEPLSDAERKEFRDLVREITG